MEQHQGFIQDFSKRGGGGGGGGSSGFFEKGGGGNHLTPPTYQETVPITNALTARICLWKKKLGVFEQLHTFCCNRCHFAAVYALKPPYYNYTCADLKGGGGGGESSLSLPPV